MGQRLLQPDQAVALLYHARSATPFFSRDGQPCASIPAGIHSRRILPLRSADFRDWLTANYYSEFEAAPSEMALRVALRTLEARAQYGDVPEQKVDRRISFEGDPFAPSKIFIDLANQAGDILEITSQGWSIANNLSHPFCQSSSMLPLAIAANRPPPATNPLHDFAALFHLSSHAHITILTWLLSALRPIAPYPILVLRGPASSGKSLLARALRTLIDPSTAPLRRFPERDRDLLSLALNNWILVFDQVLRIPLRISEALCALSSGEALELAQPDARAPALVELARPIILIAPLDETQSPWTPPRSLANRTVVVDLVPIAVPRTEGAVWSHFETLRAPVLAILADAVSSALAHIRDIDLGNVARFPDCAAWAAAAAPPVGLDAAEIVANLSDTASLWTGPDPLRDALHTLLRSSPEWSGDAVTLLEQLRALAPLGNFPSDPTRLLQALARIPGVTISDRKTVHGRRTFTVSRVVSVGPRNAETLQAPYARPPSQAF